MSRLALLVSAALVLPATALAQSQLIATVPGVAPLRGAFVLTGFSQVYGKAIAANKVKVSSFTLTEKDATLNPQLLKALAQKTRFPTLVVEHQSTVGGRVTTLMRWTLRDALITSVQVSEPASSAGTTQWSVSCTTFDFESLQGTRTAATNVGVE